MSQRVTGLPTGHWIYRLAACAVALPALIWLWFRGLKEPGYRQGLAERLGFVRPNPSVLGGLWIHVASVGEAKAGLTLLKDLQANWGAESVLWTTQTPAARRLLAQQLPPDMPVFFAPLDTHGAVKRFLSRAQPRTLLLLERELWPEWLWQCEQRAVEVAVINARLRSASARRWPYRSRWMRQRLHSLHLVLCADPGSADHFLELGLPRERIHRLGNLKFDQLPPVVSSDDLVSALAGRLVIVAASTHQGDEDALLPGWRRFLQAWQAHSLPDAPQPLLVLAPRHPQRFGDVAHRLEHGMGLQPGEALAIRSQGHPVGERTQIWLLDSIGELAQLYASARLCLMGGTWAPVGGHNALEPLAAGCPVIFGPHTHQFPELYAQIRESQCGVCVAPPDIWEAVLELSSNPAQHSAMQSAGRQFMARQQGSAHRTIEALRTLPSWPHHPMPAIRVLGTAADTWWTTLPASETLPLQMLTPDHRGQTAQSLATGSGRGQAYRVEHQGRYWVLRHYRRGGWMARFIHDTYPPAQVAQTRAMQELVLLRAMRSMGLPVPTPVAAHYRRTQPHWGRYSRYRADIAIEWLPATQNLVQLLRTRRMTAPEWAAVGRAIAALHRHQIFHADLNAHNLLLNAGGEAFVVDFDKCERRSGAVWKTANLARLKRSLQKELGRHALHWIEADDWPALLSGYEASP